MRNGKIARLPNHIREELNHRLNDAKQGPQLIEWLNSLPEVQEVLKADFDGQPINKGNLHEWRKGGFRQWRAEQQTLTVLQNAKDRGDLLAQVPSLELTDTINTLLTAGFAIAVERTDIRNAGKTEESLERLSKMLRDFDRIRRRQQADERIALENEWLKLEHERLDCQFPPAENQDSAKEPPLALTAQEKAQMLKEIFSQDDPNYAPGIKIPNDQCPVSNAD